VERGTPNRSVLLAGDSPKVVRAHRLARPGSDGDLLAVREGRQLATGLRGGSQRQEAAEDPGATQRQQVQPSGGPLQPQPHRAEGHLLAAPAAQETQLDGAHRMALKQIWFNFWLHVWRRDWLQCGRFMWRVLWGRIGTTRHVAGRDSLVSGFISIQI